MSQEVMIAGAVFSDVPSIRVPDSNNVFHSFTDVTDTTATASDVASGKYFYAADGTKTAGTSSGGGGGAVKLGVLRPDAELVKSWTYDKLIVEDEGITIPAYSTSTKVLKASSTLESVTLDRDNYDYVYVARSIANPVYSDDASLADGRFACCLNVSYYELGDFPAGAVIDNGIETVEPTYVTRNGSMVGKIVYFTSSAALTSANGYSYGTCVDGLMPNNSGSTLTIVSPRFVMRGHASYYSSTYWNKTVDVRYQYVMELYRVQRANQTVRGSVWESQLIHAADCYNAGGTLT